MKKTKKITVLALIFIIILVFLSFGFYFSIFHFSFSYFNSDWGDFGDYFSGTVGILFSLIGVILIFITFYEQRKQQFESTVQQYLTNYYSLLNLIKERWLHSTSSRLTGEPLYQTGREIFGNAIGYIRNVNIEDSFKDIFCIHINVFQHYCNFLVEFFDLLDNNQELKDDDKSKYLSRFFSMLSVFELTFFAYYAVYIYDGAKKEEIKRYLATEFNKIIVSNSIPHSDKIKHIKNVLVLTPPKQQPL